MTDASSVRCTARGEVRAVVGVCLLTCLPMCGCHTALDALVLRPSATIRRTPADIGYEYSSHTVMSETGETVSFWLVPARSAPKKGTLVFIPGDDANKGRFIIGLPYFCDSGWDMILMDYQGFGESSGPATFDGLIVSTRAVMQWAVAHDPVVVGFGASLGTPVLMRLAPEFDLDACIFESSLNVYREASTWLALMNLLPPELGDLIDMGAPLLASDDYDSLKWIKQVTAPKLFIHSPDDQITPFDAAWEMFQAAPEPKYFWVTRNNHAIEPFVRPVLYRDVVNGWLNGTLGFDTIDNPAYWQQLQFDLDLLIQQGLLPQELRDELRPPSTSQPAAG